MFAYKQSSFSNSPFKWYEAETDLVEDYLYKKMRKVVSLLNTFYPSREWANAIIW